MNRYKLLSDKELNITCGGLIKNVSKTFSTIATVALAYLSFVEVLKIDKDLSFSDEVWESKKLERNSKVESIGKGTHSEIVKKCKQGVSTCYNKCHNVVVDFLRSY